MTPPVKIRSREVIREEATTAAAQELLGAAEAERRETTGAPRKVENDGGTGPRQMAVPAAEIQARP